MIKMHYININGTEGPLAVALVVLLALLIAPVAAVETIEISDSVVKSDYLEVTPLDETSAWSQPYDFYFPDILLYSNIHSVIYEPSALYIPAGAAYSDNIPFTAILKSEEYKTANQEFTGEVYYYQPPGENPTPGGYYVFEFDDLTIDSRHSGTAYLRFEYERPDDLPQAYRKSQQTAGITSDPFHRGNTPMFTSAGGRITGSQTRYFFRLGGKYYINSMTEFDHIISYDVGELQTSIDVQREVDGRRNPSRIEVFRDSDGAIWHNSTDPTGAVPVGLGLPSRDNPAGVTITWLAEDRKYSYLIGSPGVLSPGVLSLSLSPTSATVGDTITASLTTSAATPRYSEIIYAVHDPDGNTRYDTYSLDQDTWTDWLHYNSNTWQYEPSSETAAHNPTFLAEEAGTYTVTATIRDHRPPATGAALATASASCEVARPVGNVYVYVRSAETGNLIPGAHLTITDVATGTPIINELLTTGQKTYSLGQASTLHYSAQATATGYTSFGPTLFGVGDDPLPLVLWMYPDIDPDDPPFDPPDDGKTALYGFLVSQGSYQPIPGATVSLDDSSPPTTTSSTGFYLFERIDPGPYTITASADGHDQLQEQVTAGPIVLQHNMALKGLYALKVTTKDADSLQIISNATTITLNDGQESTDNPATFTVDYGVYTITAAAEGYYPDSEYQYIDKPGTTQATILLTKQVAPPTPPDRPSYPPHNVRFHCVDDYGLPLSNVAITAAYAESSSPWSWLTDLLGIPSSVEINSTTLAGTTGTDGSITFNMIETVRYTIHAHDPASNLTVDFSLYPHETQYTIQFHTRPPPATATRPLYELTATPNEDNTKITLGLAYYDRDNGTTALTFWVKDDTDGSITHSSTPDVKLNGWTNATHTVDNLLGSYTWGFNATHNDHDDITASRSITLHGAGRLVDLGLEDDFWYYLLSIIWIIGIAAIFSGSRVRFGAIIIPLIGGGIPTLIGWLPPVTAPLIAILTFIGVFVYMRKSEYKMYR